MCMLQGNVIPLFPTVRFLLRNIYFKIVPMGKLILDFMIFVNQTALYEIALHLIQQVERVLRCNSRFLSTRAFAAHANRLPVEPHPFPDFFK
jgi:hypothetical protein